MTFRLPSTRPARHDRRNGDAVILHHHARYHALEHLLLDLESGSDHGVTPTGAQGVDPCSQPPLRCLVQALWLDRLDPCPHELGVRGQTLPPLRSCGQLTRGETAEMFTQTTS